MRQEVKIEDLDKILKSISEISDDAKDVADFFGYQQKIRNQLEMLKLEKEMISNEGTPHTLSWELAFKRTWQDIFGIKWSKA